MRYVLLVLTVALGMAPGYSASQEKKSASPEAHFRRAVMLSEKDADGSIAELRAALQLKPDFALAHYFLGAALQKKGDLDGALLSFRQVIRLKPYFARAHFAVGEILSSKGDLDGAIAAYRAALRLAPDFGEAGELAPDFSRAGEKLMEALRAKGDLEAAKAAYREFGAVFGLPFAFFWPAYETVLEDYRQAVRRNPNDALAHNNLGWALAHSAFESEWLDAAITAYRRALKLKPDYVEARLNLAQALILKSDLSDLDGAIVEYREGARLNPEDAAIRLALGGALSAKGDRQGAIAEFSEVLRLKPDDKQASLRLFSLKIERGDVAALEEFVKLNPKLAEGRQSLGEAFLESCQLDQAIAELREALRLKPELDVARLALAMALGYKGDWAAAWAEGVEAEFLRTRSRGHWGWPLFEPSDDPEGLAKRFGQCKPRNLPARP